jgi:hypothetical protein
MSWDIQITYFYEMDDGSIVKSDLFYTYDYGIRIYKQELGHITCIMEDKWVLELPRYITQEEWTIILLKSNGVIEPPHV